MGATGDKIKGKAMQIEGKVTGDKIRMGQGALKEAKGKVEGAIDRTASKAKKVMRGAKAKFNELKGELKGEAKQLKADRERMAKPSRR